MALRFLALRGVERETYRVSASVRELGHMAHTDAAPASRIPKSHSYRADLLQEPEKDHPHGHHQAHQQDTHFVDVSKRLVAVSVFFTHTCAPERRPCLRIVVLMSVLTTSYAD